MLRFEKKLALVTGGTRGIGAAIARSLLSEGAEVIVTGTGKYPNDLPASFECVDFTDADETDRFVERMAERPIDILVNNAGINRISPTSEIDPQDWDKIQRVNVRAPFLLCSRLAPQMAKRGYGRILNITSIFGTITKAKRLSYSTSKFALVGMTKALAVEMARSNVVVNSLAPGFIDTELTRTILSASEIKELAESVPLGRLGVPAEIAQVALFLLSSENTLIVGQNIVADGGFSIT